MNDQERLRNGPIHEDVLPAEASGEVLEDKSEKLELREFTKRYSSLARSMLARRLVKLRDEQRQTKEAKAEEKENKAEILRAGVESLEQELADLEKELAEQKIHIFSAFSDLKNRFSLKRDIRNEERYLGAVRKNMRERYLLMAESDGAVEADEFKKQLKEEIRTFYSEQGDIKEEFERDEENVRSVEEISKNESVFFIHTLPLGENMKNTSQNNPFVNTEGMDFATKAKLVLGLEPTISCSTLKKGDTRVNMFYGAGLIIGKGRVLFAHESDAATVAEGPFVRRSKDSVDDYDPQVSDVQRDASKNIRNAIEKRKTSHTPGFTYNEFTVEEPCAAGIFFDAETYAYSLGESEILMELSKSLGLPLYMWDRGEMYELPSTQIIKQSEIEEEPTTRSFPELLLYPGSELGFDEVGKRAKVYTEVERKQFAGEALAADPFPISREAIVAYEDFTTGESIYEFLKDPSIQNVSADLDEARKYQTLKGTSWDEDQSRYVPSRVQNVEEWLANCEKELEKQEGFKQKSRVDLSERQKSYWHMWKARGSMKEAEAQKTGIFFSIYGVMRAADKVGDNGMVSSIEKFLNSHKMLKTCAEFAAKRLDVEGNLLFIPNEDIPKEYRDAMGIDRMEEGPDRAEVA